MRPQDAFVIGLMYFGVIFVFIFGISAVIWLLWYTRKEDKRYEEYHKQRKNLYEEYLKRKDLERE